MGLLSLVVALFVIVAFAPAASAATKTFGGYLGDSNYTTQATGPGGLYSQAGDLAIYEGVDAATSTDKIFVIERGTGSSGNRVQRLDVDGNFERAWGKDVSASNPGTAYEICTVSSDCQGGLRSTAAKGEFNQPSGVAVDQANGWVYVLDRSNFRVQKFDLDGNFILMFGNGVNQTNPGSNVCTEASGDVCKIGVAGPGVGQLGSTTQQPRLAIDQTSHDVFVADPANRRVLRFNSDGTSDAVPSFGSAAEFAANQPLFLAIDSSGIVYASNAGPTTSTQQIQRYDLATGLFVAPISSATPTTAAAPLYSAGITPTVGLSIDADTDGAGPDEEHLLVARDPGTPTTANTVVQELDIPSPATDPVTTEVDRHVFGTPTVNGVGVNSRTGVVYLPVTLAVATQFPACACGAAASGLVVLSDGGGTPPEYGLLSTTTVGTTTATLQGLLDPNGLGGFRIEYSVDGTTWQPASLDRYVSGSDQDAITVSISGLDPNTVYRMRMVGTKYLSLTSKVTTQSAEATFLTDSAPPDVTTLPVGPRTDTTAQLRATVDPNGTATNYWFEYGGDINYGTKVPLVPAPAGAGNEPLYLIQDISGLVPGTIYHYRVVADGSGAPVAGTDQTFTTQPSTVAAPGLGVRAFELVSPADKVAGIGVGPWYRAPGAAGFAGIAAYEGERFAASSDYGSILLEDGAQAYVNDWAFADRVGDSVGWVSHSPITHAGSAAQDYRWIMMQTATPDLSRVAWRSNGGLLRPFTEMETWQGVGDLVFAGDWAGRWELFGPTNPSDPTSQTGASVDLVSAETVFSADGSTWAASTAKLRGLATPTDPTLALDPSEAIRNVYKAGVSGLLSDNLPNTGSRVLVSACAGGTTVPAVDGGDLTGQSCGDGALVSERGATQQAGRADNTLVRTSLDGVVSDDGSRLFFMSPDPQVAGVPNGGSPVQTVPSTYCSGAGTGSLCPPQLFARHERGNGTVATRWISRSRSVDLGDGRFGGPPIAGQDASLLGQALFEGASDDGDKVFFRSNSPLTPDDPNGGVQVPGGVTTGEASISSWDLFMYDFPDDSDVDPGDGTLTRLSAGPTGASDPNNPQTVNYAEAALRFVSEDGSRVYFATAAPLAGASPTMNGTVTAPGGTAATTDQANLYLFDAAKTGGERWRFIARLPRASDTDPSNCATTGSGSVSSLNAAAPSSTENVLFIGSNTNCVRGTPDARFVTWFTPGRLTVDDPDGVSMDIYGYDASRDELSRLSAAQGGVGGSYPCGTSGVAASTPCYGDRGFDTRDGADRVPNPSLGVATAPAVAGDRAAFFQSRSRLVPEDTDLAYDVYQWRNGDLSLLTPGDSPDDGGQMYKGNDASGRNVYFATLDRMSWQDFDSVLDIYTARVGGGIAAPTPPDLCVVLTGGCHGGGVAPITAPAVSSDGPTSGDARPAVRAVLSVAGPGRAALRRAARTGVLALRVRSTTAGRVSVLARGRLGKGLRRLGAGAVRLANPGAGTVRIRLTRLARSRLASGRSLRLTLRVAASGARARAIAVRLPGASR